VISHKKWKAREAELLARIDQLAANRDEARADTEGERYARKAVERELAEAEAANIRLDGRNRQLAAQLDKATAREDELGRENTELAAAVADAEEYHAEQETTTAARMREVREQAARRHAAETQELRRTLLLRDQAITRLCQQLTDLQAANEAHYRQDYDTTGGAAFDTDQPSGQILPHRARTTA
jgi:chromosome segregation ATPase